MYYVKGRAFKTISTALLVVAMVFGCLGVAYGQANVSLKAGDTAKTTTNLNLRAGASMESKVLMVAAKGTQVVIEANSNDWYKVSLANGKAGFMHGRYLVKVEGALAPVAEVKQPVPAQTKQPLPKVESTMVLATTTSTQDTGLLDVLVPAFDKKYGVTTKVIAVGTGEAIEMGKQGNADVILVHARASEDQFVASGYGINRKDVMYNYFFLVGPKDDPAKVSDTKDAETAMKKIADTNSKFVSRGDQSGTHKKELTIWDKYKLKPQGSKWYMESGQGMGATLTMASEMGAYTLVDSGTWYKFADKVELKVVLQGDPILFNPYGVIAVNPEKYSNLSKNAAAAFVDFITSEEGQKIIGDFKANGQQLFVPDAKK
ncbi:MAG: tungsten transporter substrate-binding protein [Anaerosolibacter sp.]|jgi:tungstate transport system substrate-binding protein|uniref:substrate-binding domain-containing protein n=1 Tax=Anaerosolibacter sp. TaxID=1872527 RepID=UPI00261C0771|nr:substrate-binding domain-containing protein [Anaerosolibacter sp.]MDF2547467.1 tungsten transporter substrate-binding protein [Anaerosolibacter sp.]